MPTRRAPLGLIVFLSWKGLAKDRVVTALLVVAVTAGVAFQIPNAANLDGYRAELVRQAVRNGYGQLRLSPRQGQRFEVTATLQRELAREPGVVAAVPLVVLAGAAGRDGAFRNVAVIGVDGSAPRLPFHVVDGAALAAGDEAGVLVGASLAKRLGFRLGDRVELRAVLGVGNHQLDDDGVGKYTLVARGIVSGTFVAPEAVYVDRGLLAKELGEPAPASLIAIYTPDDADLDAIAARIGAAHAELVVRTWREDSVFAASAIASGGVLASLSRAMVALAVIVPVWALLYIHALHRRRDLALLLAVGLARAELFWIQLGQALLVGLAGTCLGGLLGYAIVGWFERHPIFAIDVFSVRPVVSAGTFVGPMLLVLAFTLVASLVPAWRAARADPAAILRGA